jgi:TolB-like protein/Tfp pilus assembly protein PilF/class 3 adenylate cyclase
MPSEHSSDLKFEIGHVLFIDIVGYSKLLINEQGGQIQKLKQIVRGTEQFRLAEAEGKVLRLPTGDGGALVFRNSPEAPVLCALEITKELQKHPGSKEKPQLRLRMGIHSGPVNEITDLNEQANIAGAGINTAQRVMDCGDAGHILLSKRVADDLEQYAQWRPLLHELGECEVKHGVRIHAVNFYTDEVGNPEVPDKFKRAAVEAAVSAAKKLPINGKRFLITGVIIAALAVGALLFWQRERPTTSTPTSGIQEKSIAVLPFENRSRDLDNAYFAEGIQDEILTRLAKVADLKVISRTSTQHFKSAPNNLPQIGKQLGVANILEGSVQKANDQVRVNVQLINAITDAHLWADTYDRKLTDIFVIESDIAKTIADMLQAKLNRSAEHVLASRPTENPEAHELYLKGRYFWNRRTGENLKKAADYFQQAIGQDPQYALAYSGLADCHVLLPLYPDLGSNPRDELPKALKAARKAVELDDTLAEAHASLARALASDLQLSPAISEFNRAIELNPNYATARQWFGECLQSQGQLEEALAELKRAQELDPLSLVINTVLGFAFDTVGKSDDAIAQLRKTIEIDPNFRIAHIYLGNVLEHNGQLKEAIVEYEKSNTLQAESFSLAQLARAYFLVDRKAEAQQVWGKLKSLSERQYVPAYAMAVVQLTFGNKDEAIRLLEKSYEDHAPFDSLDLGWILVDHRLDSLRSDPRFKKLIMRIFSGEPR